MRKHKNFWDKNASRYDRFMRKDQAAYDEIYALIRPVVKAKTVLELATGTGLIAKNIVNAAARIEATDASAEMIAEAKRDNRSAKLYFSVQDMFCLQNPDAPWLTGLSALADTPKGGLKKKFLTRRRRKTVRLWRFEQKVAFVKVKKALIPHFSKLHGQPAALHTEVIRKLLAGERDVELIAAPTLRLGGKIGHQLCPRRALAHVGELFVEPQVLLCQFAQQVEDDPAMVGAGGGAHAQNASYMQKHHRHWALRLHAHVQHRPRRAGEHLREGLPRPDLGEDVTVSPDILLHDEDAARQHKAHLLHRLPGAEQAGAFGKGADPCPKAGEHGGKLIVGHAGEKRRRMEHRKKIFHKKSSFVENSTDLLLLV